MIDYKNENCIKSLKDIEDKSVQCISTDPPYNIGFHGKYDPDTGWDSQEEEEYKSFTRDWLTESYRILKDDGILWMCMGPTQVMLILEIAKEVGFIFQSDMWKVYARQKGRGAKNKLKSLREDVLCFTKSDDFYYDETEWEERSVTPFQVEGKARGWRLDLGTGLRDRWKGTGDVLYFSSPYYLSKSEKMIHSCQKPLLLWAYLIMSSTKKNDLVVDPFMGSGSSGIACYIIERSYIGCELDSEMYRKASQWKDNVTNESSEAHQHLSEYLTSDSKGFRFGLDRKSVL